LDINLGEDPTFRGENAELLASREDVLGRAELKRGGGEQGKHPSRLWGKLLGLNKREHAILLGNGRDVGSSIAEQDKVVS